MVSRLISPVLILLTLGCPLWCNQGLCGSPSCCNAKTGSALNCDSPKATCCQERTTGSNTTSPAREDDSHPSHSKSLCQGVCGGAVLQESFGIERTNSAFLLPLSDTLPATMRLRRVNCQSGYYHWHDRPGNFGRWLCTLHMSMLC